MLFSVVWVGIALGGFMLVVISVLGFGSDFIMLVGGCGCYACTFD